MTMDNSFYLSTGDSTKLAKLLVQPVVVHLLVQVLDVQVDALQAVDPIDLELVEAFLQLGLALRLLLGTACKQGLAVQLHAADGLYSLQDNGTVYWACLVNGLYSLQDNGTVYWACLVNGLYSLQDNGTVYWACLVNGLYSLQDTGQYIGHVL